MQSRNFLLIFFFSVKKKNYHHTPQKKNEKKNGTFESRLFLALNNFLFYFSSSALFDKKNECWGKGGCWGLVEYEM